MKSKLRLGTFLAVLVLIALPVAGVSAQPPQPQLFMGSVTIDGASAPVGTTVSAWIEGAPVKSQDITTAGQYALPIDIDGRVGKMVVFKVNGLDGGQTEFLDPWEASPIVFNLVAESIPEQPAISVSPTSKNFGAVVEGDSSVAQTFTVSNIGSAPLNVGTISITGAGAAEFAVQNDMCSGQTIAPGGSRTLEVVFSPTSMTAKSATLNIPSNDPTRPIVAVSLSGTGVSDTRPVGGTAHPGNKLLILLPWIGLAVAVVAASTLVLRRHRAQS